jgi:hypothetical protein
MVSAGVFLQIGKNMDKEDQKNLVAMAAALVLPKLIQGVGFDEEAVAQAAVDCAEALARELNKRYPD